MRRGFLVSSLATTCIAKALGDNTPVTAQPTALDGAGEAIEQTFSANPDDVQLSIALRSYSLEAAREIESITCLKRIHDVATAIAAETTDNEAARNIMTSRIGHHIATSS